ncbi:MAG: hypothetical protein ACJ74U_07535 [Jatrophihabitantaceae bacterium]
MITQLRPPQSRPVPGRQLRISWRGTADGDTIGGKLIGSTVRRFDASRLPPGFLLRSEAWLLDLDRVEDAEMIDLELHVTTTGSRTVMVGDLHSPAQIEHVGLERNPRPEPYVFFRLVRRHGEWFIEAKDGDPDQVPLFVGGETVTVSIDRSASMIPWFSSGAVGRLLTAVLDAAQAADIRAVRLAASGDAGQLGTDSETIRSDADVAEHLHQLTEARRFTTGSAYVEAARLSLAQAGGDRKVAILITDSPPTRGCRELAGLARAVVAVLGVNELTETFDLMHWEAASEAGLGVVPVGEVPSGRAAVTLLSRTLNAC